MKTLNFDNYKFRASLSYFLAVGTIGVTDEQENEIKLLENERDTGINVNGNKCKWTDTKKEKLDKLIYSKENPSLPKTMETELRKIYRSEKYNRKFLFTNKYIKKGISQEEESFTTYQEWLLEVKGIKTFLKNNKERIEDDFFTGETDSFKEFHNTFDYGFDIKTSWSLETFPFKEDDLETRYEWQNLVYMHLTGIKKWKTVYALVNCTESALFNEKMKYNYAYDIDKSDLNIEKYNEVCRDLEKLHIVDYDKFVYYYPAHDLMISREEWRDNNLDIPLKDRIIEKTVLYDENKINFLKERINIARKYLSELK
jgi:hypothetical protein